MIIISKFLFLSLYQFSGLQIERSIIESVIPCSLGSLFNSNSSSFTSNLCGFPNGVFIRTRPTRRGSSPLTRTFTCKRVFSGVNYVCVDGELRKNHRQKLGLVCQMKGRCSQSKLSTPQ